MIFSFIGVFILGLVSGLVLGGWITVKYYERILDALHNNLTAIGFEISNRAGEDQGPHLEICGVYHGRECNCPAGPLLDLLREQGK